MLAPPARRSSRSVDEAISEVRKEFADLTVLAAGKVIEKSLDKQDHANSSKRC